MASRVITKYSCDRCKKDVPGRLDLRVIIVADMGFSLREVTVPPNGENAPGKNADRLEVCGDCYAPIAGWLAMAKAGK